MTRARSQRPFAIATASVQVTSKPENENNMMMIKAEQSSMNPPRLPFLPHFGSLPLIQATRRALTALRGNPIFTPRVTFARWRTQRAIRAAAKAAREKEIQRDWQKKFRLNGLTWHHKYISQDLHLILYYLRELQRNNNNNIINNNNRKTKNKFKKNLMLSSKISAMTLVNLERSYAFLLDNVYDIYNSLEKNILFPWIINGISNDSNIQKDKEKFQAIQKALMLFSKERDRLEDRNDVIRSKFARLVCTTGFSYTSMGPCNSSRKYSQKALKLRRDKRHGEKLDSRAREKALREGGTEEKEDKENSRRKRSSLFIRQGHIPTVENGEGQKNLKGLGKKKIEDTSIIHESSEHITHWKSISNDDLNQLHQDLSTMIEDSDRLHKTERSVLYPLMSKAFSDQEQNRLTSVMVYSMRSALAKLLITIYHQSVEKQDSRIEWRNYKKEVPLPIRVYTPIWRARLYDGTPLGWLRNTSIKELRQQSLESPQQ